MIRVSDLTKIFSNNKKILDSVNVNVKKGEIFCLAGPNGAGKSTLIKILCGLVLPTKGSVLINGHDIFKKPEKSRPLVGLVTGDERSFYWRLTGRQNLEFFASLYNMRGSLARKRIECVENILRIEDPDKVFQQYSSGAKQRLSVARALLSDPQILFMDELTKNLDFESSQELKKFIKDILVKENKKTIFFSTHNLWEIEELSDRIAFISKGKIKTTGNLQELKDIMREDITDLAGMYDYFINSGDDNVFN